LPRPAARTEPPVDEVRALLAEVRDGGDAALRRFTERFDAVRVGDLRVPAAEVTAALDAVPARLRAALEVAHANIESYHAAQLGSEVTHRNGAIEVREVVRPVDRVGCYVPSAAAPLVSTVLMTAVPARVAGVAEVVLVTAPGPDGSVAPGILAAAALAGVDEVYRVGGPAAIAALAYGTETIPPVDKIVGPGNLYVAAAKRLVFGQVDIDSIAGPSEILVLADDSADPCIVAADLLSQAEHDEAAYPLLACTSTAFADAVERELDRQLTTLPRREIATTSLRDRACAFVVDDVTRLAAIATALAVEHVAIHTREPRGVADVIRHAGAIFVGSETPEAAGDYLAGPSHVLPTGGAARFSAPLGVYDFVSRTSIISYEAAALRRQAASITALARSEGLEAHARAVEAREPPTD
jgi:histidinol dehydrogenase